MFGIYHRMRFRCALRCALLAENTEGSLSLHSDREYQ